MWVNLHTKWNCLSAFGQKNGRKWNSYSATRRQRQAVSGGGSSGHGDERPRPCHAMAKGSFGNYVDQILHNLDPLPPPRVDNCKHLTDYLSFLHVIIRGLSTDHLPTFSCPHSYWMTPKEEKMEKVTIIRGVKMIVEQKAVESTDEIDWLTNWEKACEKKIKQQFLLRDFGK